MHIDLYIPVYLIVVWMYSDLCIPVYLIVWMYSDLCGGENGGWRWGEWRLAVGRMEAGGGENGGRRWWGEWRQAVVGRMEAGSGENGGRQWGEWRQAVGRMEAGGGENGGRRWGECRHGVKEERQERSEMEMK